MFVRLTRPVRAKAGWFIALLYLFCVLAPGVALALGDAASCHPAGTGAAVGIATENHRYIASPMKRLDQGLPLVTCHGFSPPTFLHQGLALRASVPAITEAIRPGGAGLLSWSCGWHDRR